MNKPLLISLGLNAILLSAAILLRLPPVQDISDKPLSAPRHAAIEESPPTVARPEDSALSLEKTFEQAGWTATDRETFLLGKEIRRTIEEEFGPFDQEGRIYWKALRRDDERRSEAISERLEDLLGRHAIDQMDFSSYPLPPERVRAAAIVDHEYTVMQQRLQRESQGIHLPEDQDLWRLLDEERRRDLEALFSPDELFEYEVRNASFLQGKLQSVDATEEEFREVFRLQYEINRLRREARSDADMGQYLIAARESREASLRDLLGEDRYRQFEREGRHEYMQAIGVAERLNLPRENANRAYELRERANSRRQEIESSGIPMTERQAALNTLSTETRDELTKLLGDQGALLFQRHVGLYWLDE